MKRISLTLFAFLLSLNYIFSQESEPTLEQCLSWLEQNVEQTVSKKGGTKCDITISLNYKRGTSKSNYVLTSSNGCAGVQGYEFDYSDIDSYELEISTLPSFAHIKILDKNKKYKRVPVIRVNFYSKKGNPIFKKFYAYDSNSYIDAGGNIHTKEKRMETSMSVVLRYFDTYDKNQEEFSSSNIQEIKAMYKKVFDRIFKLTSKNNVKSIDNNWFKN